MTENNRADDTGGTDDAADRRARAVPAVPAVPESGQAATPVVHAHPNDNPTVPIEPYPDDHNETRPYPPFAFPWEKVERQGPATPPASNQPYAPPPPPPVPPAPYATPQAQTPQPYVPPAQPQQYNAAPQQPQPYAAPQHPPGYGGPAYPPQQGYPQQGYPQQGYPPGYPGMTQNGAQYGAQYGAPYGGYAPVPVRIVTNGTATAALVLGICGFILMGIPFGIGLVLGGIPDILAVVLGIVALNNNAARGGVGRGPAIVGLVLGAFSLLSVFIGAGWLW